MAAVQCNAQLFPLVAFTVFLQTFRHTGDFENAEIGGESLVFIEEDKERGTHIVAQNFVVRGLGVQEPDVLFRLHAQFPAFFGVEPDVGIHLVQVIPLYQNILCKIVRFISSALLLRHQGAVSGGNPEIVISVNPGDFLDDVGLDGHVLGGAPGGNLYLEDAVFISGAEAQRI